MSPEELALRTALVRVKAEHRLRGTTPLSVEMAPPGGEDEAWLYEAERFLKRQYELRTAPIIVRVP